MNRSLAWLSVLAGALVFLTVMKELPATLLLSPIGFDTLAVDVWSLSREAYFARAAYSAIMLVALTSNMPAYYTQIFAGCRVV